MFNRFVAFIFAIVFVLTVAVHASAENTYDVDSVVVSWNITEYKDFEIEVVDEEGNLYGYYDSECPQIGDVVTLTIFDFGDEELNEIIDANVVDHLDTLEMVQWLVH